MIITITGKPCSGKSTIAKILEKDYGFKRIGVGDMFKAEAKRRGVSTEEFNTMCLQNPEFDYFVDQQSAKLGKELEGQRVIFDSRLAWHFVSKSFKVYVDLNDEEMVERLINSDREGKEKYTDKDEASRTLASRRKLEVERYKKIYGVDISDLSNFDFVLDSSNKTPDMLALELINEYNKFCQKKE